MLKTNMSIEEQAAVLAAAEQGNWQTVLAECQFDADKLGWSDRFSETERGAIEAWGYGQQNADVLAALPEEATGAETYEDLVWAVSHAIEEAMRQQALRRLEAEASPTGQFSVSRFARGSMRCLEAGLCFADRDTASAYLLVRFGDPSGYGNSTASTYARVV